MLHQSKSTGCPQLSTARSLESPQASPRGQQSPVWEASFAVEISTDRLRWFGLQAGLSLPKCALRWYGPGNVDMLDGHIEHDLTRSRSRAKGDPERTVLNRRRSVLERNVRSKITDRHADPTTSGGRPLRRGRTSRVQGGVEAALMSPIVPYFERPLPRSRWRTSAASTSPPCIRTTAGRNRCMSSNRGRSRNRRRRNNFIPQLTSGV